MSTNVSLHKAGMQLDRVVVRLHTFGAGVASLIPTQYPVRVLARPLMLKTRPKLVNDLKAAGTTVTKNTTGNTTHCHELKSCSKVTLQKKARVILHLSVKISMIQRKLRRECCRQMKQRN